MNLRFFLFSCLLLQSCSSLQPRSENAVGIVKSVFDKDNEKRGELFLDDSGLWAYVGKEVSKDIIEGTLLFYGSDENSHSFAVVETHSWGLVLQRLDSEPLNAEQNDDFIVSDMSAKDQRSWSMCTTKECLLEYEPGVVFHIYARDSSGRLSATHNSDLSFPRTGIVRVSAGEILVDGILPEKFLAIASLSRDYSTMGRIGNEGCSLSTNDETIKIIDIPFPTERTPVDISLRAVEESVDGFIACNQREISIAIPSLWRAHHPMAFGTFSIAPIISSQVYNIPTPSKEGLHQLSRFITSVATGDFAAADFWLDAFIIGHPQKAYREFIKNASEISTAANRPENAIRQLKLAMKGHWNPENDGRWNAVQYRIEKMVDTPRNAMRRYSKLPEFFEKEEDPIIDFLTFFSLRDDRKQNREVGKPGFLEHREKWKHALAIDQNLSSMGIEETEPLTDTLSQTLALFEKSEENPFDVFGRTPVSKQEPKTLLRRGKSQTLKEIQLAEFPPLGIEPLLSKQIYLFDSLSNEGKKEILSQLIASNLNDAECERSQKNDLNSLLELRLAPDVAENALLLWYVETGISEKCKGDVAFINAAKSISNEISEFGPSILQGILKRDRIKYESAQQISEFANEHVRGRTCETFHTSFAFALLKDNRVIEGLKQLKNASNCIEIPDTDLATLLAFSLFERTGQIEGDAEIEKKLRLAVRAVKDECPGNLPLDYELDFLVSPTTQSIASKFLLEETKPKAIQFEKTANAVSDGKKAIRLTYDHLNAGNFKGVKSSLEDAQKAFEMARFRPGLHRVRFLTTHLTQPQKKVGIAKVTPTKIATQIMEKAPLSENNANRILMKILKSESLKNLEHPDLCAPLIISTKKTVID